MTKGMSSICRSIVLFLSVFIPLVPAQSYSEIPDIIGTGDEKTGIMVLGTFHFMDSSHILYDNRIHIDISSPQRQQEIAALIPPEDSLILVDNNKWRPEIFPGRRAIPFLERDGQYWGSPPDDESAIRELERLRKAGASFIVFGWPAFWWIDYYTGLRDYLSSKFHCVLKNSRLIVFDLQP